MNVFGYDDVLMPMHLAVITVHCGKKENASVIRVLIDVIFSKR